MGATQSVIITGSSGFIGKNLYVALREQPGVQVCALSHTCSNSDIRAAAKNATVVFHLAGVNRPENPAEFLSGNVEFTRRICENIRGEDGSPILIFASSTQALMDNSYGESKRLAENLIEQYSHETGARAFVYRLPNVFGKWCRPNYNSVIATFCNEVANQRKPRVDDPSRCLAFLYVDDLVRSLCSHLASPENDGPGVSYPESGPLYTTTIQSLAEILESFPAVRSDGILPTFDNSFVKALYSTYLTHLGTAQLSYPLKQREDSRGILCEFLKSHSSGQIFVSRTKPGVTRGNHYHHTKTEKFLVLEGSARVYFRSILSEEVLEYEVHGDDFVVIDIPPGYTHSIENIGAGELVTLFWANEIFNPEHPDTFACEVHHEKT